MAEKRKCLICEKEFITYKSHNKKYCGMECRNKGMIGRKLSKENIKNISRALKEKCRKGYKPKNLFKKGKEHPYWIEDRSRVHITETPEYSELRIKIFKRDNYTCQHCKERGRSGYRILLELHHIKERKNHPELALDDKNCITLCRECHKKTDSYLNRWN